MSAQASSATTGTTRGGAPARSTRRRIGLLGWLLLFAVMVTLPWLGVEQIWVRIAVVTAIYGLISSGLNLTFGWAGEVSFAQVAIFAFGAYLAAVWSNHGQDSLIVLMIAAGVGSAILGALTALPGLRLGSWALAITSFLLVIITPDLLIILQRWTGGNDGLSVPEGTFFGVTLSENAFYVLCIVTAAVWIVFLRNLVTSRHGHALLILRESPVLASALGINIKRTKVVAYALAAIPAGVAGVLFDFLDGYVSPPTFGLTTTLTVIAASVIGGSRSLLGPFVATAVLMGLPIWSASLSSYSMLISGALLVIAGLMSVFNLRTSAVFGVLPSWLTQWGRGETSLPDDTEVGPGEGSEKVIELDDHRGSELVVDGLTVHFGGVTAVDGVSLCAKPGQITALIGPNGSGKTSLLNLISGFYRPTAGQVHVSATDVSGMSVAGRSRRGISRTFQTPLMPPYSTVADVVSSGRYTKRYVGYLRAVLRTPGYRRALHEDEAAARQCLRMLGIEHTYPLVASSLPLGTRRLVELARVMVSRPEVILLDEPASGLSPDEVGVMSKVLSAIRERGATVVLVEHNFRMIQSLADTVYVLDQGGMLAQGSIEEIQANEDVARIYLGTELTPVAEHGQMGQTDA